MNNNQCIHFFRFTIHGTKSHTRCYCWVLPIFGIFNNFHLNIRVQCGKYYLVKRIYLATGGKALVCSSSAASAGWRQTRDPTGRYWNAGVLNRQSKCISTLQFSYTGVQKLGCWQDIAFKEYVSNDHVHFFSGMSTAMKEQFWFLNVYMSTYYDISLRTCLEPFWL